MCNTNTSAVSIVATGDKTHPPPPPPPPPPPQHLYITIVPLAEPIKRTSMKSETVAEETQKVGQLFPLPTTKDTLNEAVSLFRLSFPIAMMALLMYSRSVISMLFLGSLGDLPLAAGSLAIAFANITGYSVLSGLSLGMEPICTQAVGANQPRILALTLRRSVLFLLCAAVPISLLWVNMSTILLYLGQDPEITALAHRYLLFSLPDLLSFSLIHPIRIYLRSQSITRPLTLAAALATAFHLPANLLLVTALRLGVSGVAAASAASNVALLLLLLLRIPGSDDLQLYTWRECFTGWGPLAKLAAPSCVSVCLEWWWYELMILLCGLLPDPKPAVAAMGVLIQTTALVYVFPSSLGFGVSTRVGNELGANRPARARASAAVAILLAAVMGFTAMGFVTGVRDRWGRMFTDDGEILRLTAAALPIVGLCELGNCPQTVGCGVLRGSARPAHAANVNLGAFYLVGLPVAVGLGLGFGLGGGFGGLWMGLLAAQVCCAGLMLYVVGTTDWEAQARRAQILTCATGPGAGAGEEERKLLDEGTKEKKQELYYEPSISIKVVDLERSHC